MNTLMLKKKKANKSNVFDSNLKTLLNIQIINKINKNWIRIPNNIFKQLKSICLIKTPLLYIKFILTNLISHLTKEI